MTPFEEYKSKVKKDRPWHLLNSKNFTNEATSSTRYDICLSCPELIDLTKQCKKCGCFMQAKVKLEQATCPIGKW